MRAARFGVPPAFLFLPRKLNPRPTVHPAIAPRPPRDPAAV